MVALTSASAATKCHGLALSSGSNVGPYQAGALQALLESGTWDTISGVTEGALNAYILSLYDKDEPLAAKDHLHKFWTYLGSKSVYVNYDFGLLEGLMVQDSMFQGKPMMDLLDEVFANETLYP